MPAALTVWEVDYFTRYGGVAARARYGDNTLTVARTTAPLRHLHAPDECLRAAGHDVRHVGTRFGPLPTTTYSAEAPDDFPLARRSELPFRPRRARGERGRGRLALAARARHRLDHGPARHALGRAPDSAAFEAAALRALDLPLHPGPPPSPATASASPFPHRPRGG